MNARQKAKQLKKIQARFKAIHFFKMVRLEELEYTPEETIKKELATEIGQTLLDANLIRWKTEDVPKMCCIRYSAIINALTQEEEK